MEMMLEVVMGIVGMEVDKVADMVTHRTDWIQKWMKLEKLYSGSAFLKISKNFRIVQEVKIVRKRKSEKE